MEEISKKSFKSDDKTLEIEGKTLEFVGKALTLLKVSLLSKYYEICQCIFYYIILLLLIDFIC